MSKPVDSLQIFLSQRGYSPRTAEAYLFWARRIEAHFPDRDLKSLKAADIYSFFAHLQTKRFKSESIRQATSAIRFLFREILRKPEVANAVPSIKEARARSVLPTQKEILAVIQNIPDVQAQLAIQCIYGMGLELQEVRNLRIKNFDFDSNQMKFSSQRTKITRAVPLPTAIVLSAKTHCLGRNVTDYIFTVKLGKPLSESTIQRAWATARTLSRVGDHATIRSLRHCYVRHLELLGVPLVDVLSHLGIRKDRALAYYAAYHDTNEEITFSPLDRIVHDDQASLNAAAAPYVSETRIDQISMTDSENFDFSRLIALLQELNLASRSSAFFSVAFLVRAIIDHVPPLFSLQNFGEVANNYPGTKSFKKNMANLNDALRNIADGYLHSHIRSREELPLPQQVDFRAQLDQLLTEIVRVHKRRRVA